LEIKNNGNIPIKVIWDNSSITDSIGTHRLFISGMKYIDSNNTIPPVVIPVNGKITRDVYNADNVEFVSYGNTWRITPMLGFNFTITLCIEKNGEEHYQNIEVKVRKI